MESEPPGLSVAKSRAISSACLAVASLALSAVVLGQARAPGNRNEPISMTAATCEVQVGELESACGTDVELLDNERASVLFVTVKSTPEDHEISFYTEHVGMLVIGVDDGMMITTGDCRNNVRRLRCRSDDREAMLKIQWER